MSKWTYQGEAFTIRAKGLSDAQKDAACALLMIARDKRANPGDDRWEVDRMPADHKDSQTPPKKRGRPRKVVESIRAEMPGEATTDAVQDETVTHSHEETRYAQGFYREVCKQCREPITRGRAPIYHEHCRPVED